MGRAERKTKTENFIRTFNSGFFRWFALVKHELKIEEGNNFAIRTKMGCPSNSNWCVLNVIWLTGYWICVTVAIFAAQIMRTEKDLVHDYTNLPMALITIRGWGESLIERKVLFSAPCPGHGTRVD